MRSLPSAIVVLLLIVPARSRPLAAQCDCPPSAPEEKAVSVGIEQLGYRDSDHRVMMFSVRSTGLPRNSAGNEFSFTAAFAPYPVMFVEGGPALNLTEGPVSLLMRFGIGMMIIPSATPDGYAGVGLLVRVTDHMGLRFDAMRRYFYMDSRWDYFQSLGVGLSALTPAITR